MTEAQQGAAIILTSIGLFIGWWVLSIFYTIWGLTIGWYLQDKRDEKAKREWDEAVRLGKEIERERREQNPEEYAAQEAAREAARASYTEKAAPTGTAPISEPEQKSPDTSNDFCPHTVRYADGSTRTVWSKAEAEALMTWGGATSYKGAGDLFETHRANPFFKNPFIDD